jgi:hypothetical protein
MVMALNVKSLWFISQAVALHMISWETGLVKLELGSST